MNWDLTDEEKLLKASAAEYFLEKFPIQMLRRMRDTQDLLGFPREAFRDMANLGWTGILISEDYGGSNFGFRGLGLILEGAGRQLAATPLLSTVAGASHLLQKCGSAEQKESFLPAIASGDTIVALAHDEANRHGHHIETAATRKGSQYVLNGR